MRGNTPQDSITGGGLQFVQHPDVHTLKADSAVNLKR
jgi:hypothetical protein